jgi:hypothetical protein
MSSVNYIYSTRDIIMIIFVSSLFSTILVRFIFNISSGIMLYSIHYILSSIGCSSICVVEICSLTKIEIRSPEGLFRQI